MQKIDWEPLKEGWISCATLQLLNGELKIRLKPETGPSIDFSLSQPQAILAVAEEIHNAKLIRIRGELEELERLRNTVKIKPKSSKQSLDDLDDILDF